MEQKKVTIQKIQITQDTMKQDHGDAFSQQHQSTQRGHGEQFHNSEVASPLNYNTIEHAKNSSNNLPGGDASPYSKNMKSEFGDAIRVQ